MATYTYEDTFIVDSVDSVTLDEAEANAIDEIGKLEITDTFYVEKLVMCRVYTTLAAMQLENEGMADKYAVYSKEFDRYYRTALNSRPSSLGSIPIARG